MAKLWVFCLVACAGVLGEARSSLSQEPEPLVTDRPDFTESASVPGGGRVQVEGGWTVEETGDVGAFLGEILVRIGLGERFEARIEPATWISADGGDIGDDVSGLDDAGFGMKACSSKRPGRSCSGPSRGDDRPDGRRRDRRGGVAARGAARARLGPVRGLVSRRQRGLGASR